MNIKCNIYTITFCVHTCQFTLTTSNHIHHLTRIVLWYIDSQFLNRLTLNTIYFLENYLWLANLKFITFTTHSLYKNTEVKYTTTTDNPLICRIFKRTYAQSEVLLKLFLQTVIDMAASTEFAFFTEEWRIIDSEKHTHCRLINCNRWQCLWIFVISNSIANLKTLQTYNSTDITTFYNISRLVTHTFESTQFLNLSLLFCSVTVTNSNIHTILQFTTVNTTDSDTTCIARIVKRSNQHLRSTL